MPSCGPGALTTKGFFGPPGRFSSSILLEKMLALHLPRLRITSLVSPARRSLLHSTPSSAPLSLPPIPRAAYVGTHKLSDLIAYRRDPSPTYRTKYITNIKAGVRTYAEYAYLFRRYLSREGRPPSPLRVRTPPGAVPGSPDSARLVSRRGGFEWGHDHRVLAAAPRRRRRRLHGLL